MQIQQNLPLVNSLWIPYIQHMRKIKTSVFINMEKGILVEKKLYIVFGALDSTWVARLEVGQG